MLVKKILELKKERNAVILAHNYTIPEVQDIADFAGDSLGLSKQAASTDADVIVFCGVHFMAETAKILSPDKTVLIPDKLAGCPMADMITARQLKEFKVKYPGALVVCYVNSSAEVKALSDYCCTSGNAVELISRLPKDKQVLFVPDKNLGSHVKQKTGRDIVIWPGYCPTHVMINREKVKKAKEKYPDAVVLAHPECPDETKELADELLSTGQMLEFARKSEAKKFIIATEPGIIHPLRRMCPEKRFLAASENVCCDMKRITLEKLHASLERMQYEVIVPEEIADKARKSLDRMLEVIPASSAKSSNS